MVGSLTVCEQHPSNRSTATSAIPDPVQEAIHPNENEPNTADENKSNREPAVSATAKPFLRGVKDSADAFVPPKSVAECPCFILDNHEV